MSKKVNKQEKTEKTELIQPLSGGGKRNTRKQIKNVSRKSKKFVTDSAAGGFRILK